MQGQNRRVLEQEALWVGQGPEGAGDLEGTLGGAPALHPAPLGDLSEPGFFWLENGADIAPCMLLEGKM